MSEPEAGFLYHQSLLMVKIPVSKPIQDLVAIRYVYSTFTFGHLKIDMFISSSPRRLERAGWLDSEWRQTENSRRAKYYRLTRAGTKQLEVETAEWNRRAAAVARLLKAEA